MSKIPEGSGLPPAHSSGAERRVPKDTIKLPKHSRAVQSPNSKKPPKQFPGNK